MQAAPSIGEVRCAEASMAELFLQNIGSGDLQAAAALLSVPTIDLAHFRFPVPPLHVAAGSDGVDALNFLLKNGFDPNARDKAILNGTILHRAARVGRLDILEVAKKNGADLNAVDSVGDTALHVAIRHKQQAFAEALLAAGCAKDVPNLDMHTPYLLAVDNGMTDLVRVLPQSTYDWEATANAALERTRNSLLYDPERAVLRKKTKKGAKAKKGTKGKTSR